MERSQSDICIQNYLFVGNLPYFCNEKDLQLLFSRYARILSVTIFNGNKNKLEDHFNQRAPNKGNVSTPYAVVALHMDELHNLNVQQTLIANLNGIMFMGRPLIVSTQTNEVMSSNVDNLIEIHFSFATRKLYPTVTESVLRELIASQINSTQDLIIDINIVKYNSINKEIKTSLARQTGRGWLYVKNLEDRDTILANFIKRTLKNITLDCKIVNVPTDAVVSNLDKNPPKHNRTRKHYTKSNIETNALFEQNESARTKSTAQTEGNVNVIGKNYRHSLNNSAPGYSMVPMNYVQSNIAAIPSTSSMPNYLSSSHDYLPFYGNSLHPNQYNNIPVQSCNCQQCLLTMYQFQAGAMSNNSFATAGNNSAHYFPTYPVDIANNVASQTMQLSNLPPNDMNTYIGNNDISQETYLGASRAYFNDNQEQLDFNLQYNQTNNNNISGNNTNMFTR